ncbi:MAG: xanthine dehydrogenase family protein subunit M [Calditrichaeota bacterium]|nr:xanthine dehydrogenase family protein subunit M [Calditrichota bacterium]
MSRIEGMRGISQKGSKIRIGAMTTITDLERSELIRDLLPSLWDGACSLGSPLVRNRGTLGGNICNARPAADTAIPALAHSAKLVLANSRGARIVDHNDFVTGPGRTIIKPDEILTAIVFEVPENSSGAYYKLANRKALEISVVGAAASIAFNEDGIVTSARIALGAVAPKPLLVTDAAAELVGKKLTSELIASAAHIAEEIAKPITDHRGTKDYRSAMVEVLVRRVIVKSKERFEAKAVQEVVA